MIRRVVILAWACAGLFFAGKRISAQQAEILTSPRPSTATTPLVFSFVTASAGFDTEITISNTSADTLGSSPAIFSTDPMYATWGPTIDGHAFTTDWISAMQAGDAADVPVMIGWNHDEGTLFISLGEMNAAHGQPSCHVSRTRQRDRIRWDSRCALTSPPGSDAVTASRSSRGARSEMAAFVLPPQSRPLDRIRVLRAR